MVPFLLCHIFSCIISCLERYEIDAQPYLEKSHEGLNSIKNFPHLFGCHPLILNWFLHHAWLIFLNTLCRMSTFVSDGPIRSQ